MSARLAIVVPTLDEEASLPGLLEDLSRLDADVVVCDGGSRDGTVSIAARHGARVVHAPRGRATQLRAGAEATDAPWLFFVHADCRLPGPARSALLSFLEHARVDQHAHFRFALAGPRPFHRFIEVGQRLRERLTGLAYGDQGLVVSREAYEDAGGYPEWRMLEDVGLLDALASSGRRVALGAALPTSPRRYDLEGGIRSWIRNFVVISRFRAGTPADVLAERYPRRPGRTSPTDAPRRGRRTVVVFAKAPRPGAAKTRLAAAIGEEEAIAVYRRLGRDTVDAIRRGGHDLVVCYDPPDEAAEREIVSWLGAPLRTEPQRGADLGARMASALESALGSAEAACVVGTDIPGLGSAEVEAAFTALRDADVVLGPAEDGGYYLMALSEPRAELFEDIPWSTSEVLDRTVQRANAAGLTVAFLDPMRDVDTVGDVPPELMPRVVQIG